MMLNRIDPLYYLHFLKVLQLGYLIVEKEEFAVLRLQIQLQVQAGTWYVSMMQFYKNNKLSLQFA